MSNNRTMRYRDMEERLVANSIVDPRTGCWYWIGKINNDGYAILNVRVADGGIRSVYAHRQSLITLKGENLDGPNDKALHKKGCPRHCICPDHLRKGTTRQNAKQAIEEGRQIPYNNPRLKKRRKHDELEKI